MEFYYAATLFLMVGCGFMSFHIGKKEGVMKFLEFLEEHTDRKGMVTVRITETEFEVVK
mgnify:CR=1 FL=1